MATIHKTIPFINGGEISVPSDSSDQRLITHENTALTQADYMFRYDGKIFVRTRTREAVEDDWGEWGSWSEISGGTSLTAGTGISISSGTISNTFSNITSGDANDITYNFQGYIANAVTNKPTTNGGGLCCVINSTGTYGYQLFGSNGTSDIYYRNLTNGTWGSWIKLYSPESLIAGDGINITSGGVISNRFTNLAGVDLNTVKYNCLVWCNDACTNLPKNYGGMLLCCFSSNNSSYGAQIFSSYSTSGKGTFYRRCNGGTWTAWTEFVSQFESTTVQSANLTNCTGTINLRASGQMVMVDFGTVVKCTTGGSGWVKLFQLPNGFTPVARQKFLCADDSTASGGHVSVAEARVDTNGSFSIYNAVTGHNYWGGTMIYLRS